MRTSAPDRFAWPLGLGIFLLSQVAIMLVATSSESLWIDEFWTAHFSTMGSLGAAVELLMIPSGSQTPLHFLYYYAWGQLFPPSEWALRLANLPLFLLGQGSLYLALRAYPKTFAYLCLAVSALQPMVWQYANEARPYIMMYAGAQMILAYLLHLHAMPGTANQVSRRFTAIFTAGAILLFGASMLGAFWVLAAALYVAHFHQRHVGWRYLAHGWTLLLLCLLLAATGLLSAYYLNSVLQGGGASRISSTTPGTLLFNAYELLGLSGIGPGRHELRASGLAALRPYWIRLAPAAGIVLFVLAVGVQQAKHRLGTRTLMALGALALLPVAIVVASGFIMHWRVLGRHLIASIPILCLLFALGLARLLEPRGPTRLGLRSMVAVAFMLVLAYSSASLRFAERHKKDDYQAAAVIAKLGASQGKRVWWAADYIGANYYRLPGEFDFMGELTGAHRPPACRDLPGVQATANLSAACMQALSRPDIVILSRPDAFDQSGELVSYLQARDFVKVRDLQAIEVWQPAKRAPPAPK
jgi:hypothetical protein